MTSLLLSLSLLLEEVLLAVEAEGEEAVLLLLGPLAGAARGGVGVGVRRGEGRRGRGRAALGGREDDAVVDGAAQDGRERGAHVEVGVLELVRERDERVALVGAEARVQLRRGRTARRGAPLAQQVVDVLDAAAHVAVQAAPHLVHGLHCVRARYVRVCAGEKKNTRI